MTLQRARVIRASDLDETQVTLAEVRPNTQHAAIVRREVLAAQEEAAKLLLAAERDARARLDAAEADARVAATEAFQRGYEDGLARAAAELVGRVATEQAQVVDGTDRIVELAKLLAERVLGGAIALDDTTVRAMALTLIAEVRGARRVLLRTHPEDAKLLAGAVAGERPQLELLVEGDPELGRGDFQLVTDVGSLDGRLGSRLQLLADQLRQALAT